MTLPLLPRIFIILTLLLSINTYASVNIFVKTDSHSVAPYYSFYKDAARTVPFDITSGGSESLYVGETYTFSFQSPIEFSHPFYVSDNGYEIASTHLSLSGDGSPTNGIVGTQNFSMTINESFDIENDILSFFCTWHSNMIGTFNVATGSTDPIIGSSGDFKDTQISTWTRVLTTTRLADGASSQAEQTFAINVTSLPEGGADYRIYKTTANGSDYFGDSEALDLGLNIIKVSAVDFDRTVKIQFNQAAVEYNLLIVNGTFLYEGDSLFKAPSGSALARNEFLLGTNAYPYVYTSTTIADGDSSQAEQTFTLNVTALPEDGANYRIYKTTANGSDYFGESEALDLGLNIISVAAVGFDRAVKLQLSTDVAFDLFINNGNVLYEGDSSFTAPSGSVLARTEFSLGTNAYPYVYTSTTIADGASSQAEQTFTLNVTALPEGGANYRIYKTTANGSDYFANPVALDLGLNVIKVTATDFNRAVKLQLSTDVAIDLLIVNGNVLYEGDSSFTAPSGSVLARTEFSLGTNAYPYVYTSTTIADGASSQAEQTFTLNVTALPEGGANYRIYKTTANGNDFLGDPEALTLGENTFSVAAVDFDRAVKLQLSADVAIDRFINNGEYIVGTAAFTAPSGSILVSTNNDFTSGPNAYPYVYTSTTIADGASSQAEQTFTLNVTALPVGGANYRIYKTTANGSDYFAPPKALTLGENTFSVAAVGFDRAVKLQLSTDVAIDLFINNGAFIVGTVPTLTISSDAVGLTLEWTDTAGFELQHSDDLNSWTSTEDSESPYTELLETSKFYRLSNE